MVTIYKEKAGHEHLNDTERFNILGALLEGEAETLYNRHLSESNKTTALKRVWHSLKLTYGYRDKNPMTQIYECSTRLSVESNSKGLRSLRKDLIFCLECIEDDNGITLDNPALLSNFVKPLTE